MWRKVIKVVIVLVAAALYLVAMRLFATSEQPYYILGIAVVGLASWILGSVSGLIIALLLIPLTKLMYGDQAIAGEFMKLASSPPYIAMQVFAAIGMGFLRLEKRLNNDKELQLAEANEQLQSVLARVQELGGVHNMCGTCKKIMDDRGEWRDVDDFLKQHTKMEFSHCICPDCAEEFKKQAENL